MSEKFNVYCYAVTTCGAAACVVVALVLMAPPPLAPVPQHSLMAASPLLEWSEVRVVSVHDGDTFTVDLGPALQDPLRLLAVRVRGIDAPELHDRRPDIKAKAEAARDLLEKLLGSKCNLRQVDWDKYGGRLLATVEAGGVDVAEALVREGLARRYDGGAKAEW